MQNIIYEMIPPNGLEKFTANKGYISELQFGSREGQDALKPHLLY